MPPFTLILMMFKKLPIMVLILSVKWLLRRLIFKQRLRQNTLKKWKRYILQSIAIYNLFGKSRNMKWRYDNGDSFVLGKLISTAKVDTIRRSVSWHGDNQALPSTGFSPRRNAWFERFPENNHRGWASGFSGCWWGIFSLALTYFSPNGREKQEAFLAYFA